MEKKVGKEEQSTPGLTYTKLSRATKSSHWENVDRKKPQRTQKSVAGPPTRTTVRLFTQSIAQLRHNNETLSHAINETLSHAENAV